MNSDGRLSYFEFLRACKHMQMQNARAVWSALGRSGFLAEICMTSSCGSLGKLQDVESSEDKTSAAKRIQPQKCPATVSPTVKPRKLEHGFRMISARRSPMLHLRCSNFLASNLSFRNANSKHRDGCELETKVSSAYKNWTLCWHSSWAPSLPSSGPLAWFWRKLLGQLFRNTKDLGFRWLFYNRLALRRRQLCKCRVLFRSPSAIQDSLWVPGGSLAQLLQSHRAAADLPRRLRASVRKFPL